MENSETIQPAEPVHIGMLDCLYAAPLVQIWKESVARADWQVIEASPAELHNRFTDEKLDIGFIPAYSYAKDFSKYKLLPGISISSSSAVGVGILFSHLPLAQLTDKPVLLTSGVASTAALTRIIVEEWHKAEPLYLFPGEDGAAETEVKAVLTSGDEAVRLAEQANFLYQFDLGDIWKRKLEMPFVFSVCVARREFCDDYPAVVHAVHQELLRCRDEGLADLKRISALNAGKFPCGVNECRNYLEGIEYRLTGRERDALEKFIEILIARKELADDTLPLEFFVYEDE